MEINREILKSSVRIRRKKVSPMLLVAGMGFLTFLLITIYTARFDKLYITKIAISGNKQVDDSRIFNIAKSQLTGVYYGVYPKSNILIYPKEQIAKTLLRDISWLASVDVVGSRDTLSLRVTEREPKYLWCDDILKPILERTCYYLDKNGLAFDKAPSFSGHIYLEFYGGNKRGGYSGRYVLPNNTLNSVLNTTDSMQDILDSRSLPLGKIFGINIHNNGDYDALLSSVGKDWKIIFDLNTDPARKLRAVLDSHFFIKEMGDSKKGIEYIDLRFGKKVFYKFTSTGE